MADSPARPFKVACVQMRAGLDRKANCDAALELIAEAAAGGARYVQTPEMTNAVDRKASRLRAGLPEGEALEEIERFKTAARGHELWLHVGSLAVRRDEKMLANRAFLIAPDGSVAARYDKIHMFDVSLADGESWRESAVYKPGEEIVVIEAEDAKIGLAICYDLRFPAMFRRQAQAGAEILTAPAAFTQQTGGAHWRTLLRARAIECGAFVVAAAQGGEHEDGRRTFGHSMVVGPWGEVIAELDHDAPGLLLADIDLAAVAAARRQIPNLSLESAAKLTILPG